MFPSPYRQILVASLSAFLKPGTNIKSSTLLMAYATFSSIMLIFLMLHLLEQL